MGGKSWLAFLMIILGLIGLVCAIEQADDPDLSSGCSIVLHRLSAEESQRFHLSSEFGAFSVDEPEVRFWGTSDTPGFRESPCIVGISRLNQVPDLQGFLVNATDRKVLVGLEIGQSQENSSFVEVLSTQIDRRHHPLLIVPVAERIQQDALEVKVLCRGSVIPRTVHVMKKRAWQLTDAKDGNHLERVCNHGRNMVHGKELTVSTFGLPPYVFFSPDFQVSGVAIDLVRIVAKHLGFRVNHMLFPDWGGQDEDGNWLSLISVVFYGQADFALEEPVQIGGGADLSAEVRYMITSRGIANYPLEITFVARQPEAESDSLNILYVWDLPCWVFFVASYLAVTVVYGAIVFIKKGQTLFDSFLIPYGIIFQEFHDERPEERRSVYFLVPVSLRMLWVVSTFLLTQAFVGNLKASFILTKYPEGIQTLNEMLDSDMSVHLDESMVSLLKGYGGELAERIIQRATERNTIKPMSDTFVMEVLQEVIENGAACIFTPELKLSLKSEFLKQGRDFPVHTIPKVFASNDMGFAFPFHSPLKPLFDAAVRRVAESGVVDQLFERYSPYRSMEDEVFKTKQSVENLQLSHLLIPVLLWILGILTSPLAFLCEWAAAKGAASKQK